MDRKEIVKKLSEHFGVKSKYLGAPSFAYQVETEDEIYTIDREGKIIKSSGEKVQFESLLKGPEKAESKKLETEIDNEIVAKDFKIILPMEVHIGMIGDEYKLVRKELLKNLSGNGAFRVVMQENNHFSF